MKLTFKPYDKINEIEELHRDEERLFQRKSDTIPLWKSYVKNDKHTQFLRVFLDKEFVGILCWGIQEKMGWDKNQAYFDNFKDDVPEKVIKNVSWLYAIALDDKYRGQGLSHQLMQKYESESKKHGVDWLGLHVRTANKAKFLYKSEKFKEVLVNDKSTYMIKKI